MIKDLGVEIGRLLKGQCFVIEFGMGGFNVTGWRL